MYFKRISKLLATLLSVAMTVTSLNSMVFAESISEIANAESEDARIEIFEDSVEDISEEIEVTDAESEIQVEADEKTISETEVITANIDSVDNAEMTIVEPEIHVGGAEFKKESYFEGSQIKTRYGSWTTPEMLKAADAEAQRVVKSLVNDSMTDIEKAFVLGQYLNENVTYGVANGYEAYNGQTAYEALIVHESVCAGNASAYNMLTYYAGLNTIYLSSQAACHAWCELELDGEWYYVDPQNCLAYDTFLMPKNKYTTYNQSDIETYESFDHDPYDYLHSPQPATDHTFDDITYKKVIWEGSTGYYAMDWSTFSSNLSKAGIAQQNYYSTGFYGIEASYLKTPMPMSGEKLNKNDFTVYPVNRKGNPDGSYTEQKGSKLSSSDFTINPEIVETGDNVITVTYEKSGVTKQTTVVVTAREDGIESETLKEIKVECAVDEIMVGTNIRDYLTVIPVFEQKYTSGRTQEIEKAPVIDYELDGEVAEGTNRITVSYTYDGNTVYSQFTVIGKLPYVVNVTPVLSNLTFENGSMVYLPEEDQAIVEISDGSIVYADVEWDDYASKYDPEETEEQQFEAVGQVILDNVSNENNVDLTIRVQITVFEAKEAVILTVNKESGVYTKSFTVTMSATEGADIYYSLDDSAYKKYLGAINIIGQTNGEFVHTLKAYAKKKGFRKGEIERTYTLKIGSTDNGLKDLNEKLYLVKGMKYDILKEYPDINSKNLKDKEITFESMDTDIVKVSTKGIISGKSEGTAAVIVRKAGVQIGKYTVTIEVPAFSQKKYSLIKGDSMQIELLGTKQDVIYAIAPNSRIFASFNDNILTGKKKGSVKVTAIVNGKKYNTSVKIEEPKMSKSQLTLKEGKTAKLKLSGTSSKSIIWKSSNSRIVMVEDGKLIALNPGKAVITAKIGTHEYECQVRVTSL